MSDASSIRKVTSPLAPAINTLYPATPTLPPESQTGAGFYEGGIRFQLNPSGYNYTPSAGVSRKTGAPFVNTGAQWLNLAAEAISVPVSASLDATDQILFIADKPYNIISISEAHVTKAGQAGVLGVVKLSPTGLASVAFSASGGVGYGHAPTLTFSAPQTLGGVTATATATVGGSAVTGIVITNPGWGYTSAPTVTITPDSRDTITGVTVGTATLGALTPTAATLITNGTQICSVDINGPSNLVVTNQTLSTNIPTIQLNTGEMLGLTVKSGAVTSLAGAVLTIVLQAQ
jgi:hypothetical protein